LEVKKFFDTPEEIFVGAMLQFPLYFIVGWLIIPIMIICGLLWRFGGVEGGSKLARRLGVPFIVCFSTYLCTKHYIIFLAVPFMIWLCPASYGKNSWLYKLIKNDFLVRIILYSWYWLMFSIAYSFQLILI